MYIYIYIFIYILQSNFQLKYKNTGILARNITKLTGFFFKQMILSAPGQLTSDGNNLGQINTRHNSLENILS